MSSFKKQDEYIPEKCDCCGQSKSYLLLIFCKTRREMIKEVKKLLKRKEVDQRSIRIFALMGGAKIVRQFKAEKKYPVQCK